MLKIHEIIVKSSAESTHKKNIKRKQNDCKLEDICLKIVRRDLIWLIRLRRVLAGTYFILFHVTIFSFQSHEEKNQ